MARQIIESPPEVPEGLAALGSPAASRLLDWGRQQSAEGLADVFGYHAVQAGWPGYDALAENRITHRWRAGLEFDRAGSDADLVFDSRAWPWLAESLDLVVLPHALERSADPHVCLREVERVLIPEGQVLIIGLNPWSLWGRALGRESASLAWPCRPIAPYRLRDWLHLLGFEVRVQRFMGWTPAWRSETWMQRWAWMEGWGRRWWPALGGAYLMLATKRVVGAHLRLDLGRHALPSRARLATPVAPLQAPRSDQPGA